MPRDGKNGAFAMTNQKGAGYYDPQRLNEKHHEIIRMHSILHLQDDEIARRLNISVQMVRYTLRSKLGEVKIAKIVERLDDDALGVREALLEASPHAVAMMLEFMTDPEHDKKERRVIAQDILDRAGYGSVREVNVNLLTGDDILEIKERSRKAGRASGQIADATYTLVEPDRPLVAHQEDLEGK